LFQNKINLRYCASGWFLLQKYIMMHGLTNVKKENMYLVMTYLLQLLFKHI
jgi:hypothetical protein